MASYSPMKIKVLGHDGCELLFRINPTTSMSVVKKAYCESRGLDIKTVCFRYEGKPILDDDTPNILDMSENDCIEACQEQFGG